MARPNLSYLKNVILFIIGLPCGILTGLTGIANSVVVLPLVSFLLGLRGPRAAGTGLAATFFAALASLLAYQQHGSVRWGLALVLTVGQVIGAAWGQRIVLQWPRLAAMRTLWACLVIAIGLAMLKSVLLPGGALTWNGSVPTGHTLEYGSGLVFYLMAFGIVFVVGLVSRIVELGGVLLVPAAIFLLHQSPLTAQGTAIAVLLLASLPVLLAHFRSGVIEPQSATWLSFGAVFGGLIGAHYAVEVIGALSSGRLIAIVGTVTTLLGVQILWRKSPIRENI